MTTELREAIARLRRLDFYLMDQSLDEADIKLVCDELEAHLKPEPKFDKVAYQREYMRKHRALAKALKIRSAIS